LVSARHLEADFRHAGSEIARQSVYDRQHDREGSSRRQRGKRGEQPSPVTGTFDHKVQVTLHVHARLAERRNKVVNRSQKKGWNLVKVDVTLRSFAVLNR
jgi:hypothetical protein